MQLYLHTQVFTKIRFFYTKRPHYVYAIKCALCSSTEIHVVTIVAYDI